MKPQLQQHTQFVIRVDLYVDFLGKGDITGAHEWQAPRCRNRLFGGFEGLNGSATIFLPIA
jgi:hypothetical protein